MEWCKEISSQELRKSRLGGMGSISKTLVHIIDVEHSWIRAIERKPDIETDLEAYDTIEAISDLSAQYHEEVMEFMQVWSSDMEHELIEVAWTGEKVEKGKVIRHLIAHEIHHTGQLSIWAREMGYIPVSASLLDRQL